jgi:SAM-dependent MidA family methyltransferase
LELTTKHPHTDNVSKILRPDKLFSKELEKEIKVGDSIEVCPGAVSLTQEILSLVEVSRGTALVIDYGEDHAFSNSFRVSFD